MCIDSTDIGMCGLSWVEQQKILRNRSVQLDGGVLIIDDEKSIVKQRLRPFQRELVRWRKEE